VGPSEAETMILPRTPDESLVFDVARGLDSGSMIESKTKDEAARSEGDYRRKVLLRGP